MKWECVFVLSRWWVWCRASVLWSPQGFFQPLCPQLWPRWSAHPKSSRSVLFHSQWTAEQAGQWDCTEWNDWMTETCCGCDCRLCVRTTSIQDWVFLQRVMGRTTSLSVVMSWPSALASPSSSSVGCCTHHCCSIHTHLKNLHIKRNWTHTWFWILNLSVVSGVEHHRSHHLQLLPGLLRSHQLLRLPRLPGQLSR